MVSETLVSIFKLMEQVWLVDVLLPFILIFAIVFGILEKTQILGKDKRNANLIVAMVMAFMVVAVINYVNIINDIVRIFGLLVIMIVAFALIYGLFGRNLQFIKKKEGGGSGSGTSSKPRSSNAGRQANSMPQPSPEEQAKEQAKLENDFREFLEQKYPKQR